jgi:polar amino acid transport system ATP-binding protein
LLRCINWLERPDAGQIYLNGAEIGVNGAGVIMSDRELSRIRTRIGMVFQHFALWPHLTVLQNLMEAPVQVQRRPRAEVRDEALALLAKVGLSEKRDAFPAKLSGGQKQRVGIARALAMRPDLLLFDEPTSALDPELVGEVLVVMRELAHEGMTMVVVTHEMGFARDAATRVLFLDHGRVVETAAPEKFFSNPGTERARQFIQRYAGHAANGGR